MTTTSTIGVVVAALSIELGLRASHLDQVIKRFFANWTLIWFDLVWLDLNWNQSDEDEEDFSEKRFET